MHAHQLSGVWSLGIRVGNLERTPMQPKSRLLTTCCGSLENYRYGGSLVGDWEPHLAACLKISEPECRQSRDLYMLCAVQISRDMPHYHKRPWSQVDLDALQHLAKQLRMYCAKIRTALAPIREAVSLCTAPVCWI